MKSNMNKKLLRLVATEVFLQFGFERATEQSLNIGTDLLAHYIEALVKCTIPFQDCDWRSTAEALLDGFYGTERYQINELHQFVDQQYMIKKQIKEKMDGDAPSSLLHALKILPQELSVKNTQRYTKNTTIEEKSSQKVHEEVEVDDFLNQFIEACGTEKGVRGAEEYQYDTTVILEEVADCFDKNRFLNLVDNASDTQVDVLALQEHFMEDFSGKERYRVFKS